MGTDIMIRFPVHVLTLSILLLCACASNRVPLYVAPSSETIDTGTEMTLSGDGQYVYVFNHSSVPIIVTGLHLVACENIKNKCEVQRLQVRVPPGQRVNLATVRPDNTSRPSSFRFTYTWERAHDQ